MTEELKPCPFCGSTEITFDRFDLTDTESDWFLDCKCGARLIMMAESDSNENEIYEKLKKLWNKRQYVYKQNLIDKIDKHAELCLDIENKLYTKEEK